MATTLTFTVPIEVRTTVPSRPGDPSYDADCTQAYAAVRAVLATLRSDHDDVELFVYAGDLPEPTETERAAR